MKWLLLNVSVLLFTLWSCAVVEASVKTGSVYANKRFLFLERFCFGVTGGRLEMDFYMNNATEIQDMHVLLYPDMEEAWPSVYASEPWTSEDLCIAAVTAGHFFPLSNFDGTHFNHLIRNGRPRWWYVAISNCEGSRGTIVIPKYNITFTNGEPDEPFVWQFSKDEQGIFEASIVFFCLQLCLMGVLVKSKQMAKAGGMQYRIIQIMIISLWFYVIGSVFDIIHHIIYSSDGIGSPFMHAMRFFYDAFASLVQLGMILVISKGSYISTARVINFRSTVCICFTFFILMCVVQVWSITVTDRAAVLYLYDSPPGYVLVTLRFATLMWFWYSLRTTFSMETDELRRMFYVVFFCFGSFWLLSMPLTVVIAITVNSWERAKAVFAIEQIFNFLLSLGLWYLFRPCGNKYVPVMSPDEDRAFGKQTENFAIFPQFQVSIYQGETEITTI